jgi:purine-cytosine permease-like protein
VVRLLVSTQRDSQHVTRSTEMKKIGFAVAAATALSAIAVGLAGAAGAAPTGGGNAADAVKELQAQGYGVQINGSVTDALTACSTTGVHGVPATCSRSFTTVYVDVFCPDVH